MLDLRRRLSPINGNTRDSDNPRARLASEGAVPLLDCQLLALLVVTGCSGRNAEDIARGVLDAAGGVAGLADVSFAELCRIKGIGPARAAAIVAALELGRRSLSGISPGARLGSSSDVYHTFWPWMVQEKIELFSCAMVDAKLRLIRTEVISRGTLTASIVHPREAYRPAVRNAASGVIFAHNHPSGDPHPSDEDRRITGRLEEVGRILGIPLLDHVIIGANSAYYSFADAGELEPQLSGYRGMVLR
jgi:DNA repair protein RadC